MFSSVSPHQIRKSVRHYFLGSKVMKLGYDILTWAATQLAICYTVMPFLLLSVNKTVVYYRYVQPIFYQLILIHVIFSNVFA